MNSLVAYGSSDEEDGDDDDDDINPKEPALIPRPDTITANAAPETDTLRMPLKTNVTHLHQSPTLAESTPRIHDAQPNSHQTHPASSPFERRPSPSKLPAASAGPSAAPVNDAISDQDPVSSYTLERQRLRELTMPTVPNFDIPDSPPPPVRNSEDADALCVTTKRFSRFLDLKKQGVHFNQRLQISTSLRNPSLLPKLMDFAGITQNDSYSSSVPAGLGIPAWWPPGSYVDALVKQHEKTEKRQVGEKLDFVQASAPAAGTNKSKFR